MLKRVCLLIILMAVLVTPLMGTMAQDEPVVHGVLFHWVQCGHCVELLENILPPIEAEFGDSLNIIKIEVSPPENAEMFFAACELYDVPQSECGSVPALFIGDTYLVGNNQIPGQLPIIAEAGLSTGGIPLREIPGLDAFIDDPSLFETQTLNWQDRFAFDPVGNSIAIIVLVLLAASLIYVLIGTLLFMRERRIPQWMSNQRTVSMALLTTIFAAAVAGSLALEGGEITVPVVLAGIAAILLLVVGVALLRKLIDQIETMPAWLVPVISLAGLIVAGYLTYVEVGQNEAVCGLVGNCNAVQQSPYASLFGVLPIGVFGLFGYVLIFGLWFLARSSNEASTQAANAILFAALIFGVGFSIYLTFLEPFVIGATCAWCLTSALTMLGLLWLHLPLGLEALASFMSNSDKGDTMRPAKQQR